jgi:predicted metal-dependent hydrolase
MSRKSEKIAALIEGCRGQRGHAHYLGYFECINRGLYFEAHDVLEELWLQDRGHPNCSFYKGLIQLAGAFVHLQKGRLKPSAALFRLAETNLQKYPKVHEDLDLGATLSLIRSWLGELESSGYSVNPLPLRAAPQLRLLTSPEPAPPAERSPGQDGL